MPSLKFITLPVGIVQVYDALTCLAKFDENVFLEANRQELRISSLNSSKTAYASFLFDASTFFAKYHFTNRSRSSDDDNATRTWACKLQNRALLSIFRKRQSDSKDKETSIEKCEFELQTGPDQAQSRLVFKLFCKSHVVKTYKLTYETAEVLSATFDTQGSPNTWTLSSRTLRDVVDYFGPKTEHVDWSLHEDRVTFTSYTEKAQLGKEIIRQPTHTSVALYNQDFNDCNIEPDQHISVPVKDFRSIVAHADTMKANVKVMYSRGHRPAQIIYKLGGLSAEFTLMTKGTSSTVTDASRASTPAGGLSIRAVSQQASALRAVSTKTTSQQAVMPARAQRKGTTSTAEDVAPLPAQPLPPKTASMEDSVPPASINNNSLFFPAADDDDQQWDPQNFDDEPEMVTWDNTDASAFDPSAMSTRRLRDAESGSTSFRTMPEDRAFEIAPTQRLSQMKGIFD